MVKSKNYILVTKKLKKFLEHDFSTFYTVIAWLFILWGIGFIIDALFISGFSWFIEYGENFTNLPNYLIFVVTGISACLLFVTFSAQRKANQIAAFENRFFKFIDYHRANVDIIKYRKPNYISSYIDIVCNDTELKKYSNGKEFFIILSNEIWDMLDEYIENVNNFNLLDRDKKRKKINFIYSCLFYGAWKDKRDLLEDKFGINPTEFKQIGFDRIAEYSKFRGKSLFEVSTTKKQPYPYYTGHVNRLGNYFRNFYQAIKYIDSQEYLSPNQKYEYTKHFRAQISAYEFIMLFYNSLSDLGISWEYEYYAKNLKDYNKSEKKDIYNKLLITKYDLFRNTIFISKQGVLYSNDNAKIEISEFYPLHCSEHEKEWSISGILPFKENTEKICRYCFNRIYIGYVNEDVTKEINEYILAPEILTDKTLVKYIINFECDENEIYCVNKTLIQKLKSIISTIPSIP